MPLVSLDALILGGEGCYKKRSKTTSPLPAPDHAQLHQPRRQVRWSSMPLQVHEMRLALGHILALDTAPWRVAPGAVHRDPVQHLVKRRLRAELRGQPREPIAALSVRALGAPYPHHHERVGSEVGRPRWRWIVKAHRRCRPRDHGRSPGR